MLPTNDYKPASRYLLEKKLGKFIICLQGHIVSAKRIHEYFQEENKRLINQPRSNHWLKGKSKECMKSKEYMKRTEKNCEGRSDGNGKVKDERE